jgi:DNA mismatch repair protein MutS2
LNEPGHTSTPCRKDWSALHSSRRVRRFSSEIKAVRSIVGPDGKVLDEASMRLAELRRQIAATSQHIHDVIYGYLRRPEVSKLLQNVTVTLHGDRYVLPVKQENRGRLTGVVHRASHSGATVFVEPNECVELNNLLTDLYEDERQEIHRLLSQLSIRIHARAEEITAALRNLAQIDVLAAKGAIRLPVQHEPAPRWPNAGRSN